MPTAEEKIKCTAAVLTFNSEAGLKRCLDSAKDFVEIVICDGGSTDNTVAIATEFGCKIMFQSAKFKDESGRIIDFSGVRNQMLHAATQDWFFILDSDEYLSKEAAVEIKNVINTHNETNPYLYHALRKFEVNSVIIDCAGTYPSYQPRFFHKDHVIEFARKLHEKIVPRAGEKYGYLTKPTIVPVDINIINLKKKHAYYLNLEEKRCADMSGLHIVLSMHFNMRSVIARWIKIIRNFLFCRGTKMPLSFELASSIYSLKLCLVLFRNLVKKV